MQHDFERTAAAMVAGTEKAIAVAVAPLLKRLEELEARKPEKGEPGEPGRDAVAPTLKQIWDEARPEAEEIIRSAVAEAAAALPKPKDGKDAAGIVEALKDSGELVLTLEDGRLVRTGIRDGRDGEPGRDGFSLADFDVDKGDDGRSYILKFEGEDVTHSYELTFPVPVYCGIFKAGDEYVPGDLVTWGGCLWHCDEPTKEKPDSGPWTLAVKRGRDGKDAKNG